MPVRKRASIDWEWIAQELEAGRVTDPEGKSGFSTTIFEDLMLALELGYGWNDGLVGEEIRHLCWQAAMRCGRSPKPITGRSLQASVARVEREYLDQPFRRFTIVTSLSLRTSTKVAGARLHGCQLTFTGEVPTRFSREIPDHLRLRYRLEDDSQLLKVRMATHARSSHAAMARGSRSLDLIRGAWNLQLNKRVWSQWHTHENRAFNRIVLGPLHTVHAGDRGRHVDFWYEPFFDPLAEPLSLSAKQLSDAARMATWARGRCASAKHGRDLETALIRYVRALDLRDQGSAAVKLWSVMEFLTSTSGSGFDATARRVRFLFDDSPLHAVALEGLRIERNRAVHADADSWTRENLVRLHRYASRLMLFALARATAFESLEEMGTFLDLPRDRSRLLRQAALVRGALRFRGADR